LFKDNAKVNKKSFEALMNMKYMKSVIDPGEAVGIMAGQSEFPNPLRA
jgi:DNA-directed RNA polymerase I subunit RPA1